MLPSFRDTSRVVSPISRSAWANRSICIRRAIRSAEVSPAAFSRAGWTNRTTLPGSTSTIRQASRFSARAICIIREDGEVTETSAVTPR